MQTQPKQQTQLSDLNQLFDFISQTDLDQNESNYKYILIDFETTVDHQQLKIQFIRGYKRFPYHADILDDFNFQLLQLMGSKQFVLKGQVLNGNYDISCPGGGRVNIDQQNKTIHLYEKSVAFGRADHSISAKIIAQAYPDFQVNS